jgi:hypothetical protein
MRAGGRVAAKAVYRDLARLLLKVLKEIYEVLAVVSLQLQAS